MVGQLLLVCPHEVLPTRIVYSLLRGGPGYEEAVTQTDSGFHVGDLGKIKKALGSAEAVQHKG